MKYDLTLNFDLLKQQRQLLEQLCPLLEYKKKQLLVGMLSLIEDLHRQKAVADADKARQVSGKVVVSFNEPVDGELQASVRHHA